MQGHALWNYDTENHTENNAENHEKKSNLVKCDLSSLISDFFKCSFSVLSM